MYEPVYSTYCGEIGIGNRSLAVAIAPCFGTTFTKFENDKIYWCVNGKEIMKDETFGKREIFIAPETQWLLEVDEKDKFFRVIVTEHTKTVQTPLGDKMNQIINQKVKEAQREYQKRKQTEKRLYFYDAESGRLRLHTDDISYYNDGCRYRLDRPFTSYQAIDKRHPTPKESCFILGKVRRTIGTKDGELMDFIEPVAKFELEEDDCFFDESEWLENIIFKMLRFSILKKNETAVTAVRIQNKMKCNVPEFLKMLDKALEAGDVEKVKEFYDVISRPQDCSEGKFILTKDEFGESFKADEELWCGPTKKLRIYYENKEEESKEASWVYQNISRCINKTAVYYELRQQYNFY